MFMASLAGLIALPLMLLSLLLPVALAVALQVWLCKRRSRWLGLILPGLTLLASLLILLSMAAFTRWERRKWSMMSTALWWRSTMRSIGRRSPGRNWGRREASSW